MEPFQRKRLFSFYLFDWHRNANQINKMKKIVCSRIFSTMSEILKLSLNLLWLREIRQLQSVIVIYKPEEKGTKKMITT